MRTYLDMNNACNLRSYHGPIMFIRREKDEVMNIGNYERMYVLLATTSDSIPMLCMKQNFGSGHWLRFDFKFRNFIE